MIKNGGEVLSWEARRIRPNVYLLMVWMGIMPNIAIDGDKLSIVIASTRKPQTQIAKEMGAGEGTLSRWKREGVHIVRRSSLARLAESLEISPDELEEQVKAHYSQSQPSSDGTARLQPAERELLAMYRRLSPKAQAKVFLEFVEMAEQAADAITRSQSSPREPAR